MDDLQPNLKRVWLPRFSLLTSLLLITIVGLVVGLWRLYSELAPLRREVADLRTQLGVLTVDDENKIQIVEVKAAGSFEWNWRVRLPMGRDYWLYATRTVPDKGVPGRAENKHFLGTGGLEFNVRVRIVPNENGKRTAYLHSPTNDEPIFEFDGAKWLDGAAMVSVEVSGRKNQISTNVEDSAVLLRVREASTSPQPVDGFLIWISGRRLK